MNVFGIEDWWNLVWALPATLILVLLVGSYWSNRGPAEGPPYVGFDTRLDQYLEETGRNPATFGTALHEQMERHNDPHPGSQCGPSCFREPDGHRWGV